MMEYLQVAIRLLLAGLIDGLASVFAGAAGGRKISFAASSPAGELAAPSHKTMSQTTWYQNRGPARSIWNIAKRFDYDRCRRGSYRFFRLANPDEWRLVHIPNRGSKRRVWPGIKSATCDPLDLMRLGRPMNIRKRLTSEPTRMIF